MYKRDGFREFNVKIPVHHCFNHLYTQSHIKYTFFVYHHHGVNYILVSVFIGETHGLDDLVIKLKLKYV